MAGDSENKTDGFYSEYSFESNARRFKTNFDSIYEKYHRPFLDDDLVELKNMTIKKDNGFLQIKKSVLFGAVKLKCGRSKGLLPDSQTLEKTFTIDKNVSMAIERECGSLFGGTEAEDDDEDAETLSPVSSEDEEEEGDGSSSRDDSESCSDSSHDEYSSDVEQWNISSENSNSLDESDAKAINETYEINPVPKHHIGQNRETDKCQAQIYKPTYYQKETHYLPKEAQPKRDSKDLRTFVKPFSPGKSIFSPELQKIRPGASNSDAGSPLRNHFSSTSSSVLNTSITSSFSDLKLVSISSPLKSETLNSSGSSGKLSASVASSTSPANSSIASSLGDLTLVSLSSPKIQIPRNNRSIDKLLSSPQLRQTSHKSNNLVTKEETFIASSSKDQKKTEACFKSPTAVKRRIVTTKVDCLENKQAAFKALAPDQRCKNDEKLQFSDLSSQNSTDNWSKNIYPIANSTEIFTTEKSRLSPYSAGCQGHFKEPTHTSGYKTAMLPRTNDGNLKEISSIGNDIDSNTFCVNVSFSSTEEDLQAGIKNYDFIFHETPMKQKQTICQTKASVCESLAASSRKEPFLFKRNNATSSLKKCSCKSAQTVDVSVLSRSTQTLSETVTPSSSSLMLENNKCCSTFHLSEGFSHKPPCHRQQELTERKTEINPKTGSCTHREFKRKEFSTSDYFTDSSSPRKLPNHMYGRCGCHLVSAETVERNTSKPYNITAHSVGRSDSSCYLENAHDTHLSQTFEELYSDSLVRKPITVDRNKLMKRLALKKRNSAHQEQSLLSHASLPKASCDLCSTNDCVSSSSESLSSVVTDVAKEKYSPMFGSRNKSHQHLESCKYRPMFDSRNNNQFGKNINMETFTVSGNQNRNLLHLPHASLPLSNHARDDILTELDILPCKRSDKHTCCRCLSSEKSGGPMFTDSYINQFCPKNPFRIDSDTPVCNEEKPFFPLQAFKESLKAFRPIRNSTKPSQLFYHRGDSCLQPKQDAVLIPDFQHHQKPPKLRKISSSRLSLKKEATSNKKLPSNRTRNRMMNSSNLPATKSFFPLRASTPFGDMSISDSTLSTIVEPSSCSGTNSGEDTDFDTTISLDDDVALLS